MDTQELRMRYLPKKVRVLMVGESPPVGGTFFYAGNSNLFRYTKAAFEEAFHLTWAPNEDFLRFFCDGGFFLDDLCLHPINGLSNRERRRCRWAGVDSLSRRIAAHDPQQLIVTPKAISPQVHAALTRLNRSIHSLFLPFPAMSWQQAYVDGFTAFLHEHGT